MAELAEAAQVTHVAATPCAEMESVSAQGQESAVTKSITEWVAPEARPVTREDVIDVETVRVERGKDFEILGTYRVLAGDSILLGYLGRDRHRRWAARTAAAALTVPGGPWKTRQNALLGLLLDSGVRTNG